MSCHVLTILAERRVGNSVKWQPKTVMSTPSAAARKSSMPRRAISTNLHRPVWRPKEFDVSSISVPEIVLCCDVPGPILAELLDRLLADQGWLPLSVDQRSDVQAVSVSVFLTACGRVIVTGKSDIRLLASEKT
jgi:hypothetical protein